MKTNILCIFILLFSLTSCTQNNEVEKEKVRSVVENYCSLDSSGARLSSYSYESIKPLIAYEDEPGWDTIIGIESFNIISISISGNSATAIVKYEIVRAHPINLPIAELEKLSNSTVKLVKQEGFWRIQDYIIFPRVNNSLVCKSSKSC